MSAASSAHTTDLVHSLQAGKTVDVSRCASESTDLLPPSALPRLLRSLRLCPPSRPAGCRLPAGACHRAAVVVLRIHRGRSADGWGVLQPERQWMCGALTAIRLPLLHTKTRKCLPSIHSVTPIGKNETSDHSRLRRNLVPVQCGGHLNALTIVHSFGRERRCCAREGRGAVSSGLYAVGSAYTPRWVIRAPRCRQSRHRRAPPNANAVSETVSAPAPSDSHPFCPRPRRGDYRPGTSPRFTVSAVPRDIT